VRHGIVGFRIARQQTPEIPGAALGVAAGIVEFGGNQCQPVFGLAPILVGRWHDLHEPNFTFAAMSIGIEFAFAPNDGLDEGRIDPLSFGCGQYDCVVAVLAPRLVVLIEPENAAEEEDYQQPPLPAGETRLKEAA